MTAPHRAPAPKPARTPFVPAARPVADPRERVEVIRCAGCRADTGPLRGSAPMPDGWRVWPFGSSRWWCPTCAASGGRLDASGLKGMRP